MKKKTITKIWYSVQNCGDGSAYPRWMESEKLAELDQAYMDEGWGESCTGYITIESDGPIKIKEEIYTVKDAIKDTREDIEYSDNDENLKKKLVELIRLRDNG